MESQYLHGPAQPRLQVNAQDEERTPIEKRHKYTYDEDIGLALLIAENRGEGSAYAEEWSSHDHHQTTIMMEGQNYDRVHSALAETRHIYCIIHYNTSDMLIFLSSP